MVLQQRTMLVKKGTFCLFSSQGTIGSLIFILQLFKNFEIMVYVHKNLYKQLPNVSHCSVWQTCYMYPYIYRYIMSSWYGWLLFSFFLCFWFLKHIIVSGIFFHYQRILPILFKYRKKSVYVNCVFTIKMIFTVDKRSLVAFEYAQSKVTATTLLNGVPAHSV